MKINVNPVSNRDLLARYAAGKNPAVKTPGAVSEVDSVTFSDEALSFSRIMAGARAASENAGVSDPARIQEIKDAVRRGEYRVDSALIADRILSGLRG
jgi:flagellar biosynthesis anti-sigma factor FlgM